jgi:hypothetical protein
VKLVRNERKIRLEQIQQSKDFLVLATQKARRGGVQVESHEVYTHDAVRSLTLLAQEQMCNAILLFVRNKQGVLLQSDEVKRTLECQGVSHCVMCIPESTYMPLHAALWTRLARWWRKPSDGGTAVHIHARHADKNTHPSMPDRLLK